MTRQQAVDILSVESLLDLGQEECAVLADVMGLDRRAGHRYTRRLNNISLHFFTYHTAIWVDNAEFNRWVRLEEAISYARRRLCKPS